MVSRRPAHRNPLDALVREVWHVDLSECEDYAEFREGVRRMTDNLELTLAAVAGVGGFFCRAHPPRRRSSKAERVAFAGHVPQAPRTLRARRIGGIGR